MPFPVREGTRRRQRGRPGAAAVEFALVAPLLVMLVLGMIEFGRMMMVEQILTNAAREGARKAVLPGVTKTQVESAVDSYLQNSSVSGQSRTVSLCFSKTSRRTSGTSLATKPFRTDS